MRTNASLKSLLTRIVVVLKAVTSIPKAHCRVKITLWTTRIAELKKTKKLVLKDCE